jgi:hypothetical protein
MLDVHRVHLLLATRGADEIETAMTEALSDAGLELAADMVRACRQYPYEPEGTARVKYLLNFQLTPDLRARVLDRIFPALVGPEPGWAERFYLSPDQIRSLRDAGHEIGLHSHAHTPLSALEPAVLRDDLVTNRDRIAAALGQSPWAISYPYGTIDAVSGEVTAVAAALGLEAGFTTEPGVVRTGADPLRLPRIDTNDAPGGSGPSVARQPLALGWGRSA